MILFSNSKSFFYNERRTLMRWPPGVKALAVFVIIAAFAAGAGTFHGVRAYLTDGDSKENVFSIGNVNTPVVETFNPSGRFETQTKVVKISNTGGCDAYVRVRALWSDEESGRYFTVDWNKKYWHKDSDGFWYYKDVLKKGETTQPLLTKVEMNDSVVKSYIDKMQNNNDKKTGARKGFDFHTFHSVSLLINSESVQAYDSEIMGNFADVKDAFVHMKRNNN